MLCHIPRSSYTDALGLGQSVFDDLWMRLTILHTVPLRAVLDWMFSTLVQNKNHNYCVNFLNRYTHSLKHIQHLCEQGCSADTDSDGDHWLRIRNMVLFPEGKRRGRGACGGVYVCVCVFANRLGGSPAQGVPCLYVSAHRLVLACHWHTRGYSSTQVAPINGCPTALSVVRCASLGDKKWSGNCLSSDIRKEF